MPSGVRQVTQPYAVAWMILRSEKPKLQITFTTCKNTLIAKQNQCSHQFSDPAVTLNVHSLCNFLIFSHYSVNRQID